MPLSGVLADFFLDLAEAPGRAPESGDLGLPVGATASVGANFFFDLQIMLCSTAMCLGNDDDLNSL